jgi:hypothetical protein
MGEITNEHRIGGLEARIDLMEKAHFRLESKIEDRLDQLSVQYTGLDARFDTVQTILATQGGAWTAVKLMATVIAAALTLVVGGLGIWLMLPS